MERKERLRNDKVYKWMKEVTLYMDKYYIDGIAGLIPGGIGDATTALFALAHVYFGLFKLRSVPLTLAIMNNTLRDILLGLIPFYIGDIIDFFHKANVKNMALIEGFINENKEIIHSINRKALYSFIIFVAFIIAIVMMVSLLIWITKTVGSLIFS